MNPPENLGVLDGSKIESHVFLKQFGKADHQPCILSMDIELKKIHPPKFISFRRAVDNAEEKMRDAVASLDLVKKVTDVPGQNPEVSYQIISDAITTSYNQNYPLTQKRFRRDRHKVQEWMTDDLLKKITLKDTTYVNHKKAKRFSIEKAQLKTQLKSLATILT